MHHVSEMPGAQLKPLSLLRNVQVIGTRLNIHGIQGGPLLLADDYYKGRGFTQKI